MKNIIFDAALVINRPSMAVILQKLLNCPQYTGENLDALYDHLTSLKEETQLTMINHNDLTNTLGEYGKMVIMMLKDADAHNENFFFELK